MSLNPSDYAAATEIITWKTGWYNGLPASIRAVGVTETQIMLDNGTVAETNVRGIKGLGALRKLPGWSEVAPVVVEPVVTEPEPEVAPVEQEPVGVQVSALVAAAPPKFEAPAVPDVSLLTTLADVARAIADEVAGLARAEVVSALKVRAGEIALGGLRARAPKAEVVREVAAPSPETDDSAEGTRTRNRQSSVYDMLTTGILLPGDRLQAKGREIFGTLAADGTVDGEILNRWSKRVFGAKTLNAYKHVVCVRTGKILADMRQ